MYELVFLVKILRGFFLQILSFQGFRIKNIGKYFLTSFSNRISKIDAFFFSCSLPHWSDFTWNSYSSQHLFKLFKTRRSVLLSYCINMWTVSSHETVNSWTVELYHVFLLYLLFINSTKNATDTDLMLYIFSTLAPILRRQEGSGIFSTHLKVFVLYISVLCYLHIKV